MGYKFKILQAVYIILLHTYTSLQSSCKDNNNCRNTQIVFYLALAIGCLTMTSTVYSANGKGTEFDQYLLEKNILDPQFKIKNKTALDEILLAMSEEDSRTLPYQVDQNMIMEKMNSTSNHIQIEGVITTSDFEQFEKDVGIKAVKTLIKKNSLQNCDLLFEHAFQRVNPYDLNLKLASSDQVYDINIKNTECTFK